MAPLVAEPALREILLRLLSGLVLAPIALGAIYFGAPLFDLLIAVSAAIMAWEWDRICYKGQFALPGIVMAVAVVAAVVVVALGQARIVPWVLLAGTIAVYLTATADARRDPEWTAVGTLAIGLAATAMVWLRHRGDFGAGGVLWFVGVVWATDLGAYVIGRTIGGPKLAPVISPRKTWAGLLGGAACALVWGAAFSQLWTVAPAWLLGLLALALAGLAQAGDLGVSIVKRRYGVKDSSNLIPGHGGMLDRTDGFLVTAPVVVALVIVAAGGLGPWR
ncbi:MAG: phosphatidate cytidylyltransferase [Alphaproteobacteria bacterium]|nr:phosphatidate cytidylyltransferase [Alphaproteobacteria bacterium]